MDQIKKLIDRGFYLEIHMTASGRIHVDALLHDTRYGGRGNTLEEALTDVFTTFTKLTGHIS